MDSNLVQLDASVPERSRPCRDSEESDWEADERGATGSKALALSTSTSTSIGCLDDGALHRLLTFLDPAALSSLGSCNQRLRSLVNDPLSDRELWKAFYSQRWRPPSAEKPAPSTSSSTSTSTSSFWRSCYNQRLRDAAALGAPRKPFFDILSGGHRGPVRAACFATSSTSDGGGSALATGGADRRIRLWDFTRRSGPSSSSCSSSSVAPSASGELLCCSSPLPGSVRCVASGAGLLVSGSGVDARLAVWRQREVVAAAAAAAEEAEEAFESEEEQEEDESDDGEEQEEEFFSDDGDDDHSLSSDDCSDEGGESSGFGRGGEEEEDDDESDDDRGFRGLRSSTRRLRLGDRSRSRASSKLPRFHNGSIRDIPSNNLSCSSDATSKRPPFELSTVPPLLLSSHGGPVAAVAVDEGDCQGGGMIYSASWDMTVRVWDFERGATRGEQQQAEAEEKHEREYEKGDDSSSGFCVGVLTLEDWGWAVAPRANRVLVAEGRGAAVFDAGTGKVLVRVPPSEADGGRRGDAARVEGTRDGRTLFLARADGSLESRDLRAARRSNATTLLLPGGPAPSGLAFDDPWVALASGRGGVALLDARRPRTPLMTATAKNNSTTKLDIPRPPRRLGFANNAAVRCVEVLGRWVVGGCDDGSVRTWYFGGGGREEGTTATTVLGGGRRRGEKRRVQRRWRRRESGPN